MNKPLSQGATAKGRVPRSHEQTKLWLEAFMIREAVLVAPDNMEEKEGMYYFNGIYKRIKELWIEVRDSTSGGVPYILASFARLRVPEDGSSGCWKKEDFLRMFYWDQKYSVFYDHQPTFSDDLEWPNTPDVQPFWCTLVEHINAARAIHKKSPLMLSLTSPVFKTHPRFFKFSSMFQVQYQSLSAAPSSRDKRPRTSTDTEFEVFSGRPVREAGPSGSTEANVSVQRSEERAPTKPRAKRLRQESEDQDIEMTDDIGSGLQQTVGQQADSDRKGKGRAVEPEKAEVVSDVPDELEVEATVPGSLTEFMNQKVMFKAALKEQLSPIPCESCAQSKHHCFIALKHFHGCWRCKINSNGCSLVPKRNRNSRGELLNMKAPANWPWFITLVYHVLNVLALDSEAGPQDLPADYTGVTFPPFPQNKLKGILRLTGKQISEDAAEKKMLKADHYYALPFHQYPNIESRRNNADKWPIVPSDAEARFNKVMKKIENGELTRTWAKEENPKEDSTVRGRSRSRASSRAPPPAERARTRASSRPRSATDATSQGAISASEPPHPRKAQSRGRATSRAVSKQPSKPRAPRRIKSIKVESSEEDDMSLNSSGQTKRVYVGKHPTRQMKCVPDKTDDEEVTLSFYEAQHGRPKERFLAKPTATQPDSDDAE
ncbi:hypothetical protein QCA50_010249 [Cerrena zonata]|uniref:Zn(2)-C6 fungal-type domain-containing protein n=1 Tax=Cerrena zonata TaxID=2478898 RepID=A0AAW0G8U8_9APHY